MTCHFSGARRAARSLARTPPARASTRRFALTFALIPALTISLGAVLVMTPDEARACGGFFCNNVDPVVQTAERILFRMEDDGSITTYVEVQYAGPPSDFGWALPIAHVIDAEEVMTAPAGIFDQLEQLTAPVFQTPTYGDSDSDSDGGTAGAADEGGIDLSCDPGLHHDYDVPPPPPPDTSGVELVGEAVVGPYDIQIIEAQSGMNLSNWLLLNGYQIPAVASEPMQHYIDMDMAFIGIKLNADVPAGPIDALAFNYEAPYPSIPLILTAIAASPGMEIIAYVSAPGRMIPGNFDDVDIDHRALAWLDDSYDETNYELLLRDALDGTASGRGFRTEFAQRVDGIYAGIVGTPLADIIPRATYLTRFHTYLDPSSMTVDPYWMPSAGAPDVSNVHVVEEVLDVDDDSASASASAPPQDSRPIDIGALLLIPAILWPRTRRS